MAAKQGKPQKRAGAKAPVTKDRGAAKKAPAKKAPAKKAPAREPGAKKPAPRKAPGAKSPAAKPAAGRSAPPKGGVVYASALREMIAKRLGRA